MNWHSGNLIVAELQRRLGSRAARLAPWLEPALERVRRVPRRMLALCGLAAVVLIIALVVYTRLGPDDAAPTDHLMSFYCPACGKSFQLNDRQFEQLWNNRAVQHAGDGQSLRYRCPSCGKLSAVRREPPRPAPPVEANAPR
jgi:predicted RNA-binding Zn-ribbon protein involved in translation (DUF1610 family)